MIVEESAAEERATRNANNMAFQLLKFRYDEKEQKAAVMLAHHVIKAYKEALCPMDR